MRVDFLSGSSRNEGGLFYSVRWLAQGALRAGIEVRLISHIDEYSRDDAPRWSPVNVELYPAYGPLFTSLKLREILRNSEADVVHLHGIFLDRHWAAFQWQNRSGKPLVISPRGMLDPWALRRSAWKKLAVGALFANKSLQMATCIHALSNSEAKAIRDYGLKTPVAVIPNSVALPDALAPSKTGASVRRRMLFLGRIHPKKGLSELLAAWKAASAHENLSEWQLLIAGWDDGGHLAGLKEQADSLRVNWADGSAPEAEVCFLGPIFNKEKDALLRQVDAFILPSFSEGMPMSVLEAWSYRLPVLMTEFCNLREGIDAGAALQISPTVESIADGLAQLAALESSDLESMGERGRKLVEEKFSPERVTQQMISVYEWCLGGDRPDCVNFSGD